MNKLHQKVKELVHQIFLNVPERNSSHKEMKRYQKFIP
jgi:hypothetical protein